MKNFFFIGIAGSGMSAIAQYLAMTGNNVAGSDRLFNNYPQHNIRKKLEQTGIKTFEQGKALISKNTDAVIVSTAIENSVPEYKLAIEQKIPVLHRSLMLKNIIEKKKTIAIAGTSGKSTTTAMIFTILHENNFHPSIITGSPLVSLQEKGLLGNAYADSGDWLIVEADESDGTLVNYKPEIGIILNIDRDHKEINELNKIFDIFTKNTKKQLIVNLANENSKRFSQNSKYDFGSIKTKFYCQNFSQTIKGLSFSCLNNNFFIPVVGIHNIENALAAIATSKYLNLNIEQIKNGLKKYQGIDRRMQIISNKNDVLIIDDYAHNPVKIKNAIKSAQNLGNRVLAFFQPHGFAPLNFFKNELIQTLSETLRPQDEIYFAPVFYAGGTVSKIISSSEIILSLKKNNINAFLCSPRENFATMIKDKLQNKDVVLIMGARDTSLKDFANFVAENINQ
jgi:UDP-N-acetylmuramate--alanine ligase